MKYSLLLLIGCLLSIPAQAADPAVQKLQARIAADPYPEYLVTSLVNEVGPRFAGSDGYERAVIWALQKLQAAGFKRSEEHTSELQSLMRISYAVFCLKKKNNPHV